MLSKDERFKLRLRKDRPSTTITMSLPTDVIETLDGFAPYLGFEDHRALLRIFISEGMRKYEPRVDAAIEAEQKAASETKTDLIQQAS